MMRWLRRLFGKEPKDFTAQFPEKIQTTTSGSLSLHLSHLKAGDRIVFTFCRYESEDEAASFHPSIKKPPAPAEWAATFDRSFAQAQREWRTWLVSGSERLASELDGWLPTDVSLETLMESLKLRRILVSDNGSVTLRFETSPLLSHHDLGVDLDSENRIKDVSVEG